MEIEASGVSVGWCANVAVDSRMILTKAFIDRYLVEIPKLAQHANDLAMKLLNERRPRRLPKA